MKFLEVTACSIYQAGSTQRKGVQAGEAFEPDKALRAYLAGPAWN